MGSAGGGAAVAYLGHTIALYCIVSPCAGCVGVLWGVFWGAQEVERRWRDDVGRLSRMSIIEESHPKMVRMALLSAVGCHTVNGVAELHTQLVMARLLPDFVDLSPHKFQNKTNGVTHRRWLLLANPFLSKVRISCVHCLVTHGILLTPPLHGPPLLSLLVSLPCNPQSSLCPTPSCESSLPELRPGCGGSWVVGVLADWGRGLCR